MQTDEQLTEIAKISFSIYKKYSFLDKSSFDELTRSATQKANEQNIENFDLYMTFFTEELYELVNKETLRLISNPETKKDYLNKYIERYISKIESPEISISQLRKMARFFSFVGYSFNIDDVAIMLSNQTLSEIIKLVVDENLDIIKKKGFSFISKDSNIHLLLQSYCENNDIVTFYDEYDSYSVYESKGNKLSIEVPKLPLLLKSEERALLLRAKSGDKKAQDKLIMHNLRLVLKIASRYRYIDSIQIEDLFQTGCIGLHKAIEKFDLSTDFKFSTYASWWIKQTIVRYCQENSTSIRKPVHIFEAHSRINYMSNILTIKLGRAPTISELSDATGFPVEKINELLRNNKTVVSLDSTLTEDGDTELYNFVFYDDEDISDVIFNTQLRNKILELISITYSGAHKDRDIDIFIKRFGLDGNPPMKLEAVGNEYGITRERVRQITDSFIRRLSRRKKELEPFIHFETKSDTSLLLTKKDEHFTPTVDFYNYFAQFGLSKTKIYESIGRLPKIYTYILMNRFNNKVISKKMERYFIAIVPNIVHSIIDDKYIPSAESLDDIKLDTFKTEKEMLDSLKKTESNKQQKAKTDSIRITPPAVFPYSLHDIVIVALRLGGVNGAVRSKQEVEEFLDEKYVPENIELLMHWVETRQAKDYYFLDEIEFQNFLRNRTLREITLVGLSFGYVTGYPIENGKIAKFLDIDEDLINKQIRSTFIDYNGSDKDIVKERINRIRRIKKIGPLL